MYNTRIRSLAISVGLFLMLNLFLFLSLSIQKQMGGIHYVFVIAWLWVLYGL